MSIVGLIQAKVVLSAMQKGDSKFAIVQVCYFSVVLISVYLSLSQSILLILFGLFGAVDVGVFFVLF